MKKKFELWCERREGAAQRAHELIMPWIDDNYDGMVSDIRTLGWSSAFALDVAPGEDVDVVKAVDQMLWAEFGRYVDPAKMQDARAERLRIRAAEGLEDLKPAPEAEEWKQTLAQVSRPKPVPRRRSWADVV